MRNIKFKNMEESKRHIGFTCSKRLSFIKVKKLPTGSHPHLRRKHELLSALASETRILLCSHILSHMVDTAVCWWYLLYVCSFISSIYLHQHKRIQSQWQPLCYSRVHDKKHLRLHTYTNINNNSYIFAYIQVCYNCTSVNISTGLITCSIHHTFDHSSVCHFFQAF